MSESSTNATIITAIIGVIGSVAVALISNWDKIFPGHPNNQSVTTESPAVDVSNHGETTSAHSRSTPPPAQTTINIRGNWHNPTGPANGSYIVQQNENFQFKGWGMLPQGIAYESEGSGSIVEKNVNYQYLAQYQNGWSSQGSCSGAVNSAGDQLTATCTDTLMGTFVSTAIKQ